MTHDLKCLRDGVVHKKGTEQELKEHKEKFIGKEDHKNWVIEPNGSQPKKK